MAPALKEVVAWPLAKDDTHKQMRALVIGSRKSALRTEQLPVAVAHF